MKAFCLSVLLIISCACMYAQNPVSWNIVAKKKDAKTYELHFTASVSQPWHIYSQTTPEGGPVPTIFEFAKNPLVSFTGKMIETGNLREKFEEVFDLKVKYFDGNVSFVQIITLKSPTVKTNVSGTIRYMVCNDEQCLPPANHHFTVAINQ